LERACQEGKRTWVLKELQEEAGIRLLYGALGLRVLVEEGSKPAVEGVRRALRFCVMLSSMEARESRRKSVYEVSSDGTNINRELREDIPFRTVVLKQN
jgi:hypothetical protein